ncbi:MAG: hypothetical protein JST81_02340 [Bacteroidetes bacterium]|nr:hypothetical protein [Bacteroidota bacterium]
MKKWYIAAWILFMQLSSDAQKITFSEYSKKETRDIYFEILGKFDSSFIVYKNIRQKHMLTRYDNNMNIVEDIPLNFVPERTFNIDFITYRDFYYLIYQYQKNNIVYCKAMKMDLKGKQMDEPVQLDTTKISVLADNKIYSTTFSEDKQKILVYKRQLRDQNFTLVTKMYNASLELLDSTRQNTRFNDEKEIYSDIAVSNNGNYLFAKETKRWARKDTASELEIYLHKTGQSEPYRSYKLSLGKKLIEEIVIKTDNLNSNYVINAFYYGQRKGSIEGLFTSFIDMNGERSVKAKFNVFTDSLRYAINSDDQAKYAFDNLIIRNTIMKKTGGFIIAAEDFYTESLFNNAWNRQYYYNALPYVNSYDYYLYNPYYYGYRPYISGRQESTRYYYNDMVVLSIDSALDLEWNRVIHKKQYDVENDNFLSFFNLNAGGEVHFLFLENDKQKQVISDHAVSPGGEVKRYKTVKSTDVAYGFMPRFAKQTGARQIIIPCVYLGYILFAKIDF